MPIDWIAYVPGGASVGNFLLNLISLIARRDRGNYFGILLDGKKAGYYFEEDRYQVVLSTESNATKELCVAIERRATVRICRDGLHHIYERQHLERNHGTRKVNHVCKEAKTNRPVGHDTHDPSPNKVFPLVTSIDTNDLDSRQISRVCKIEYRITPHQRVRLKIPLDYPIRTLGVEITCPSKNLKAVAVEKTYLRAAYNRKVEERWLKDNECFEVSMKNLNPKFRIELILEFIDINSPC